MEKRTLHYEHNKIFLSRSDGAHDPRNFKTFKCLSSHTMLLTNDNLISSNHFFKLHRPPTITSIVKCQSITKVYNTHLIICLWHHLDFNMLRSLFLPKWATNPKLKAKSITSHTFSASLLFSHHQKVTKANINIL